MTACSLAFVTWPDAPLRVLYDSGPQILVSLQEVF